ncbi:hypothetical protein HPP92_009179 [Vanilla planifolia]|uniref:Exopolygalacturonase n=1 Tax=Vanilla planifolia TaxID=51239 RepID=A0A835RBW4_VANPL|nr:hypothetical protein HPP92_009179 [Vanilla planifolia]
MAMADFNVLDFGAKADSRSDSTAALLATWDRACGSKIPATMVVPKGTFFVSRALFQGPCNNDLRLFVQGTLVADGGDSSDSEWITFKYVQGLSIYGGTFDGRGQALWACKASRRNCHAGFTALTISQSKDVVLSGMRLMNSEKFQMEITYSQGGKMTGVTIIAPQHSPNTDGIHLHMSSGIAVMSSTIGTGDDCISIGPGVSDVWIEDINCGPGHGISIGSLGDSPGEAGVQNVTATSVVFTGTENGFRVKTWPKPYATYVKDITFEHATMVNVQNPIILDQNYCAGSDHCSKQSSGVKISGVLFNDVQGTSATPVAVKLDCSRSNPCRGIVLQDIRLRYSGGEQSVAQSFCENAQGTTSGFVIPPSCL